jgi:hypothetical protein
MTTQPRHKLFSFARVLAIASNTFLELVRAKVFVLLLIIALLTIVSSFFLERLSFALQFQMLKDASLGSMSIFTWLLAILATSMLLPKDVEDRTLYTILAKPVPRFEYLLGKLFGVLYLLLVSTFVMTLAFGAVLFFRQQWAIGDAIQEMGPHPDPAMVASAIQGIKAATFNGSLLAAIVAIYLKAAVCASLTLLISTFSSSMIFTIMVALACSLIGYIQPVAREYWQAGHSSPLANAFLMLVALLFPDLQLFNLVDDVAAGNSVATLLFLKTAGIGIIYVCVYLLLGYWMFSEKEL